MHFFRNPTDSVTIKIALNICFLSYLHPNTRYHRSENNRVKLTKWGNHHRKPIKPDLQSFCLQSITRNNIFYQGSVPSLNLRSHLLHNLIFKMNKFLVIALFLAVAFAEEKEESKEDGPKTYRRLIPADVLRGKC